MHESFDFYDKISGFVDEANRSIMACYYGHRIMEYKIAILVFFLSLLAHNSRVLYNKSNPRPISQVDFVT